MAAGRWPLMCVSTRPDPAFPWCAPIRQDEAPWKSVWLCYPNNFNFSYIGELISWPLPNQKPPIRTDIDGQNYSSFVGTRKKYRAYSRLLPNDARYPDFWQCTLDNQVRLTHAA
jgi:hypothetical protein